MFIGSKGNGFGSKIDEVSAQRGKKKEGQVFFSLPEWEPAKHSELMLMVVGNVFLSPGADSEATGLLSLPSFWVSPTH